MYIVYMFEILDKYVIVLKMYDSWNVCETARSPYSREIR